MRPEFSEMLKVLKTSRNVAEFCLQCPMCGVIVDDQTVEAFTVDFIEDVVANSIANNSDIENAERYNKLTYSAAQNYCLFIRESSMLDAAVSTPIVQHILNCFYEIYVKKGAHIATERECAMSRDAILALFFKSAETRKPGLLKTLKTADKRNLLYLVLDYSNMSEYLSLMREFVDGRLGFSSSVPAEDNDENSYDWSSYKVLRATFGHTIRSLVSCGVNPYEKAENGKSFVDLVQEQNFSKLIQENDDGYLEAKEYKTKEQAV